MDGSKWEQEINDQPPTEGGEGGMDVDADADATELVDGKIVTGPFAAADVGLKRKAGGALVVVGGAGAGLKKKTRRTKWVATGEEVVEAFEAITRVKFESPTRLMGEFQSSLCMREMVGIWERG